MLLSPRSYPLPSGVGSEYFAAMDGQPFVSVPGDSKLYSLTVSTSNPPYPRLST
jgi:hypothetical protein